MHIIYMLFIVFAIFLLSLFLMCVFRKKLYEHPIIDPLMILACAVFLFAWTYASYAQGWLKAGFLTFDNISPYICTVISLIPFMNKRTRDYACPAIAFLGFGMFMALLISPNFEYLFNYHQNTRLVHVSEAACHLGMGLYGFYLVLSEKVKVDIANLKKSLIFIYISVGFGVFLNYIFHRSYFGMTMYGKPSIYFIDVFDSFIVTLIVYLLGILVVMAFGYFVCQFLEKLSRPNSSENDTSKTSDEFKKEEADF